MFNKLHNKDFAIAVKTGTDQTKFAKEAVKGELFFNTSDNKLYIATTTAGASDATLESVGGGGSSFLNQYSLSFDGTNDALSTGYTPSPSTGFTTSMWVKSSNTSQNMTFFSCTFPNGGIGGFSLLSVGSLGGFYVQVKNSASTTYTNNSLGASTTRTDLCDGNWHHLAVTIDGTAIKVYLDGGDAVINSSNTSNTAGSPYATATSTVSYAGTAGNPYFFGRNGAYTNSANYWYDGLIDEPAFFETALDGATIASIYNSGVPDDLTSLNPKLWYRMGDNDSGTGTTITDQGSGGNDGTLINGPTFSTTVPS
jgi:hypothetical protein